MSAAELAALPSMIACANLYVLNWDLSAYYEAEEALDEDEYLMYLKHQLLLMDFIERHQEELAHLAQPPAPAGSAGKTGDGEEGV